MALGKWVHKGGTYYKGGSISVNSASAQYSTVIALTSTASLASVSITPNTLGAGDTFRVIHYDDADGTGNIIAVLAEDVNNVGANAAVTLEFPGIVNVNSGQSIKFIHVNTASIAGTTYVVAEFAGMAKKTAVG